MARDIEEFLRKAAERRKQAQQGGGAPLPEAPRAPQQQRPATPPRPASPPEARRPYIPPQTPQPTPPRQQTPVQAEVVWSNRESVAEHVKSHISTSQIAEHARQLGQEVGLADDKLEQRLHEKFDHAVGSLGHKTVVDEEATGGNELLRLMRDPRSLRQAILLSEILKRPDF